LGVFFEMRETDFDLFFKLFLPARHLLTCDRSNFFSICRVSLGGVTARRNAKNRVLTLGAKKRYGDLDASATYKKRVAG
jgi:hypothetical protein